jgi:hypothetical protein
MKAYYRFIPLLAAVVCLAIGAMAAVGDRAVAQASVDAAYRAIEDSFARKDVIAMYSHCDPAYQLSDTNGAITGLDESRRGMEESLAKAGSVHARIDLQSAELVGNSVYRVRYRQTREIQLPTRQAPTKSWFVGEDTWAKKDGKWVLAATKVVSDRNADLTARAGQ